MATPSCSAGVQAAARASGVSPSAPSVSADHASVYPNRSNSSYHLRWSAKGIPSNGTVIPYRDPPTEAV